MNIRTSLIASSLIAASLVTGAAHAALQGRDLDGNAATFEAYYDTDLNITWLSDANYAKTSGYDADGRMDWVTANTWAANLSFTDGFHVYDNWRLPTTLQPDTTCDSQGTGSSLGFNCTGSEMGHLYYSELGGGDLMPILESTDPDLAKFTNFTNGFYWSATEYNSDNAWLFVFGDGNQLWYYKSYALYALAVSPGDVGAVPEAQTYALMLAGLGLVGWRARWRG